MLPLESLAPFAGELPLLVTFSGGLNWTVGFLTTAAIFAIVALALNVQWGYTGTINFGVVGFFGIGAYVSALLTLDPPGQFESYVGGLELPVPVGWIGGAIAGGLLALVVGLPTLRLRDDFLAIATIGIATILRSIANTQEGLVNRARGLNGIPRPLEGMSRDHRHRLRLAAARDDRAGVARGLPRGARRDRLALGPRPARDPGERGDHAVGRQDDDQLPHPELRAGRRADGPRGARSGRTASARSRPTPSTT